MDGLAHHARQKAQRQLRFAAREGPPEQGGGGGQRLHTLGHLPEPLQGVSDLPVPARATNGGNAFGHRSLELECVFEIPGSIGIRRKKQGPLAGLDQILKRVLAVAGGAEVVGKLAQPLLERRAAGMVGQDGSGGRPMQCASAFGAEPRVSGLSDLVVEELVATIAEIFDHERGHRVAQRALGVHLGHAQRRREHGQGELPSENRARFERGLSRQGKPAQSASYEPYQTGREGHGRQRRPMVAVARADLPLPALPSEKTFGGRRTQVLCDEEGNALAVRLQQLNQILWGRCHCQHTGDHGGNAALIEAIERYPPYPRLPGDPPQGFRSFVGAEGAHDDERCLLQEFVGERIQAAPG